VVLDSPKEENSLKKRKISPKGNSLPQKQLNLDCIPTSIRMEAFAKQGESIGGPRKASDKKSKFNTYRGS